MVTHMWDLVALALEATSSTPLAAAALSSSAPLPTLAGALQWVRAHRPSPTADTAGTAPLDAPAPHRSWGAALTSLPAEGLALMFMGWLIAEGAHHRLAHAHPTRSFPEAIEQTASVAASTGATSRDALPASPLLKTHHPQAHARGALDILQALPGPFQDALHPSALAAPPSNAARRLDAIREITVRSVRAQRNRHSDNSEERGMPGPIVRGVYVESLYDRVLLVPVIPPLSWAEHWADLGPGAAAANLSALTRLAYPALRGRRRLLDEAVAAACAARPVDALPTFGPKL